MIIEEIAIGKPTGLEHVADAFKGGNAGASIASGLFNPYTLQAFVKETTEYSKIEKISRRKSNLMEKLKQDSLRPGMFQLSDAMAEYQMKPGAISMDIPLLKNLCQVIKSEPLPRPGTAFAIIGNPSGPVIYVADPKKVICGSCRTQDAVMNIINQDYKGGLQEMQIACPKCNGTYSVLEMDRDGIKEKIYENR